MTKSSLRDCWQSADNEPLSEYDVVGHLTDALDLRGIVIRDANGITRFTTRWTKEEEEEMVAHGVSMEEKATWIASHRLFLYKAPSVKSSCEIDLTMGITTFWATTRT